MSKLYHIAFLGLATILVCGLWLLVPAPVMGATFRAADYGFSADFPSAPDSDVGSPTPCKKDDKGDTLAICVQFIAGSQEAGFAAVGVEKFNASATVNVPKSLEAKRDEFAQSSSMTVTSSRTDTFQGFPAMFLTIQTTDGFGKGRAMLVMPQRAVPVMYTVLMLSTNNSSAGAIEDLNRFIDSFKIE